MVIKKEQIACKEVREQIERYGHCARKSIIEMNKQMPKGRKLNKEVIEIERTKATVLNDDNTECLGYNYKVTWTYTARNEDDKAGNVKKPINAAVFVLNCSQAAPYLANWNFV